MRRHARAKGVPKGVYARLRRAMYARKRAYVAGIHVFKATQTFKDVDGRDTSPATWRGVDHYVGCVTAALEFLECFAVAAVNDDSLAQVGHFALPIEDREHPAMPLAFALDAGHPIGKRDRVRLAQGGDR